MSGTITARRLRTIGVASAIFFAGTGIGWQIANLVFSGDAPTPMIAAIRFDDALQHAAYRPGPDRTPHLPPVALAPDASADLAEDARKLADAMRWAEGYRRTQDGLKLAAAVTHGWTEVAANARRFGPGRYDVRRVIQAQIAHENKQNAAQQVQLAGAAAKVDMVPTQEIIAEPVVHRSQASAAKPAGRRQATVRRNTPRSQGLAVHRRDHYLCPLTWLHTAMQRMDAELRTFRHHRVLG